MVPQLLQAMILRKLRRFMIVSVLPILISLELAFLIIHSVDEVVKNLAEEEEQRILDTYDLCMSLIL
ncbi:hypothetical protein BGX38DRAFT_871560 [Terfezia claveryi]|nr:hypothetical protein BGX38DRAFT_871560 [Terfezia claveryi]